MAPVTLPELPYSPDALTPVLSRETLDYHYGKHHKAYVDKLNSLLPESPFADGDLERIIREAPAGAIFNNAAQIWNHTFYWRSLSPTGGGSPTGDLAEAIDKTFGSLGQFKTAFTDRGMGLFGSGWVWLVKETDGGIAVVTTSNAANPMREGATPLLTVDVWEHAYYIDYRNARKGYLDAIWEIVDWDFAEANAAR